ncbi:MAG: hypothetical protein V1784_11195 [bacterium]
MTIEQARELPPIGAYVRNRLGYYSVRIDPRVNPHDLWFWPCNRAGRPVHTNHQHVIRVALGSPHIPCDTNALSDMERIYANERGFLPITTVCA